MNHALLVTLGAALVTAGCSTTPSDSVVLPDTATEAEVRELDAATSPPARTAPPAASASTPPPIDTRTAPRSAPVPARTAPATFREFTIPAGTTLTLRLTTAVASDTSRVEDPVAATLAGPVLVDGASVVPTGAEVSGIVTVADGSARVKGRGLVTLQFNSVRTGGSRYDMNTEPVSWLAPATKGEDAVKIGVGAGAGAAIGGILGGKKGAARGAAIGGAAGTGVVLATRGEEVRLPAGTDVTTTLSTPLTVRLNVSE